MLQDKQVRFVPSSAFAILYIPWVIYISLFNVYLYSKCINFCKQSDQIFISFSDLFFYPFFAINSLVGPSHRLPDLSEKCYTVLD